MRKFLVSQQYIEEQYRHVQEILDKYIHINVSQKTEKMYKANFLVPAMEGLNNTGTDITYSVTLSGSSAPSTCEVNNADGKGLIRCKAASLMFSNSRSGMNQLSHTDEGGDMTGVNAALVFTTVVKAVDVYVQKYKPLCITFYPYHSGLTQSYVILCKVAARQFKYTWGNPNTVMANIGSTPHFYLFHDDLYKRWLSNRVAKTTQEG